MPQHQLGKRVFLTQCIDKPVQRAALVAAVPGHVVGVIGAHQIHLYFHQFTALQIGRGAKTRQITDTKPRQVCLESTSKNLAGWQYP